MNCLKCNVEMVLGQALQNVPVAGLLDFPGQAASRGQTVSMGPEAYLLPVLKCPQCGHSLSAVEDRDG